MRVVICGAGMAGLTLGHALKNCAEVVLVEREASAADTGGYRISLNDPACRALQRVLPTDLYAELRATSDTGNAFEQFTVADARLRPMIVAPEPPRQERALAQRQALRVLLARDLAGQIRFSSTVVSVQQSPEGATATLDDGTLLEADLVVAADGADSAAVASLLGHSPTVDLGLTGIAGWAPLAGKEPPDYLRRGPALAFSADGTGVFLSLYRPPTTLADAVPSRALPDHPSLIWGTITPSGRVATARGSSSQHLTAEAERLVKGWSPWLSQHVRESDPGRTSAFRFRAADPAKPIADWVPNRVTALGDAVHAMPPTGGRGASTAICDAADLADALQRHFHGESLSSVLTQYQRSIGPRARSAIRESLGPVRIIKALSHRPVQLLAHPLLSLAGTVGARRWRES
ncbi:FAD-dependent oxidoreductase [Brevibacterium linens]|uniref:FAD-dependent oxidoreductase n=1 Tax=Brevibacterium linens TaxID=1703 RepID=UPI003F8874EB